MNAARRVNIHEAKTHFSKLLHEVEEGGEVVIARAGKPVAKLVPHAKVSAQRESGFLAGRISVADNFDDPLPPEIQRHFDDPEL